jgi:hypothetical protein
MKQQLPRMVLIIAIHIALSDMCIHVVLVVIAYDLPDHKIEPLGYES